MPKNTINTQVNDNNHHRFKGIYSICKFYKILTCKRHLKSRPQ